MAHTARTMPVLQIGIGCAAALAILAFAATEDSVPTQVRLLRIGALVLAAVVATSLEDAAAALTDVQPTSPLRREALRAAVVATPIAAVWILGVPILARLQGTAPPVRDLSVELTALCAASLAASQIAARVSRDSGSPYVAVALVLVGLGAAWISYPALLGSEPLDPSWPQAHSVYALAAPLLTATWMLLASRRETRWALRR